MCDPETLLEGTDVLIVGFLGNRRSTAEAQAIDEFDIDVISEFRRYPGILSYSSMERTPKQWANLVVHQEVGDREAGATARSTSKRPRCCPRSCTTASASTTVGCAGARWATAG